jgi:hypothetical protein
MDKLRTGIKVAIVTAEALAFIALVVMGIWVFNEFGFAYGEGMEGQQVWVLCEPDGCVNLREKPKGRIFGGAMVGAELKTDGKTKGSWLHVFNIPAEEDSGWISSRYITYSEPEIVMCNLSIRAEGRVACREWIGGKVKHWLHDGEKVYVYYMSDEWAVTEIGYIMTEFFEEVEG